METPLLPRATATMISPSRFPDAPAAARPEVNGYRTLPFASCYVYVPRGEGLLSEAGHLLCQRVKTSDPRWLPRYAVQVLELCARESSFRELFARDAWLVPVPGCTPAAVESAVAHRLAVALHALGLAHEVWPGITRRVAVTRSATAVVGNRPSVRQHYESFSLALAPRLPPRRIVLVDDVITKGRTLLAAAARLRGQFPHADIRAFAMVRTMGFLHRAERLLEPCVGFVHWGNGDARREP